MYQESFVGMIGVFAGNFIPLDWMACNGQMLPINQYDTLYALLGTTYGGDGVNTFGLPDLRGRTSVHQGQLAGGSNYVIGQMAGNESITLTMNNLPPHTHTVATLTGNPLASNDTTGSSAPSATSVPASGPTLYNSQSEGIAMNAYSGNANTTVAGGSQPISIISPALVMNYVISVYGIYPSRN